MNDRALGTMARERKGPVAPAPILARGLKRSRRCRFGVVGSYDDGALSTQRYDARRRGRLLRLRPGTRPHPFSTASFISRRARSSAARLWPKAVRGRFRTPAVGCPRISTSPVPSPQSRCSGGTTTGSLARSVQTSCEAPEGIRSRSATPRSAARRSALARQGTQFTVSVPSCVPTVSVTTDARLFPPKHRPIEKSERRANPASMVSGLGFDPLGSAAITLSVASSTVSSPRAGKGPRVRLAAVVTVVGEPATASDSRSPSRSSRSRRRCRTGRERRPVAPSDPQP